MANPIVITQLDWVMHLTKEIPAGVYPSGNGGRNDLSYQIINKANVRITSWEKNQPTNQL